MKVYDLIIIGAGPAGMTAAVYAARKKIDFLIISKDIGGQAAWSGDVENYTGYQFITGPELALKFQEHITGFGIDVLMPEIAQDIQKENNLIKVLTDKSTYLSKTAIIATGKKPRELNIEGEQEFKNKGLTYCATCDGPIFRGKPVAVIGGGNSALDAALQMIKISPRVYIIDLASELKADKVMVEKLKDSSVAEILNNSRPVKIYGDTFVKGIEVEQNNKKINLGVKGIFVEIGLSPNSECAKVLKQNKSAEIIVDSHNRTNMEGVFAAGDVTNIPEKQIIIACGEGSKASLSAFHYLLTHKF